MPNKLAQAAASIRAHISTIQLAGVALCLPPLIFPDHVPDWSVWAALGGLALIALLGFWIGGRAFTRTPLDLPIGVLLVLLPLNLLISADRALTLPHVFKVVAGVAVFYGLAGALRGRSGFALAAWLVGAAGVVVAAVLLAGTQWGSAKFSWLPFQVSQFVPLLIHPFWKAQGFVGFNANLAGGTLAMLLPLPAAYALWGRKWWIRLPALLAAGAMGVLLLLTRSRGAIVALAAGVAAMLLAADWRWALVVAVAAAGLIAAWPYLEPEIGVDVDLEADLASALNSAQGRLELWSRGRYMMQDFAFTGVGMGAVVKALPLLYPAFSSSPDARLEHLHNLYVHTGAELGFPGLIALLAFLIGLLALCWQAARRARGSALAPLARGMLGVVVVYCAHGLTDTLSFSPKAHLIAWSLFGIAAAVGRHVAGSAGER